MFLIYKSRSCCTILDQDSCWARNRQWTLNVDKKIDMWVHKYQQKTPWDLQLFFFFAFLRSTHICSIKNNNFIIPSRLSSKSIYLFNHASKLWSHFYYKISILFLPSVMHLWIRWTPVFIQLDTKYWIHSVLALVGPLIQDAREWFLMKIEN